LSSDVAIPHLTGALVTLEPLLATHPPAMFALSSDADTWAYVDDVPASVEALVARNRRLEARRSPDDTERWLHWAVVFERAMIGYVQATVSANNMISIGYVIGSAYASRRFGTDSVRTMLTWLATAIQKPIIEATVDERNRASRALLAKLHFTLTDDRDPQIFASASLYPEQRRGPPTSVARGSVSAMARA
jgi:RimJ/RimL family protein N-acetyltransferase